MMIRSRPSAASAPSTRLLELAVLARLLWFMSRKGSRLHLAARERNLQPQAFTQYNQR